MEMSHIVGSHMKKEFSLYVAAYGNRCIVQCEVKKLLKYTHCWNQGKNNTENVLE